MSSDIEGKEYDKVDELYQEVQYTEFLTVYNLNRSMPYAWICAGLVFEIRPSHQHGKFDAMLCWIKPNRSKKIIAKIEIEFGKTQEEWDTDLPRKKWWRGISLIKRKGYDICDLFIKMSPTYNSIILIDTRNDFIQNNSVSGVTHHNLGFVTNSQCYEISWDVADKNKFIVANNNVYQDGNIFLLEKGTSNLTDERKKMYQFIEHKFFPDYLRQMIKSYELE